LRESLIDIRMDLRQLPITRSLNNRMGTGRDAKWYPTQIHQERHMSAVRIARLPRKRTKLPLASGAGVKCRQAPANSPRSAQ
jgi:hypothetical protein